ncbi:MAG TPA: hypothetical protein VKR26_14805 [Terriglobales bacterium]|nr:hypothetical protein [Terriglobales bacterium]
MLATLESELFHCADAVRSLLLPSLYFPVAVNCRVAPGATLAFPGVICSEDKLKLTGGGGLLLDCAPPEPQLVSTSVNTRMMVVGKTFVMGFSLT